MKKVINIFGDLNFRKQKEVIESFDEINCNETHLPHDVEIFLNSTGGECDCANVLRKKIIQISKNHHVKIVCGSTVMSAATILIYFEEDKIEVDYEDVILMFHKPYISDVQGTGEQLKKLIKFNSFYNEQMREVATHFLNDDELESYDQGEDVYVKLKIEKNNSDLSSGAKKRRKMNRLEMSKLSDEEQLEVVKQDSYALKYVKEQTPEICLEAVKQDGLALQYVEDQTDKICLEAVKEDGFSLQYVENRTEEICLEAVKRDGHALRYVQNQTDEICLEAVKQNGYALVYVKEQTDEICLEAVKRDGHALRYVNSKFLRDDLEELNYFDAISNLKQRDCKEKWYEFVIRT